MSAPPGERTPFFFFSRIASPFFSGDGDLWRAVGLNELGSGDLFPSSFLPSSRLSLPLGPFGVSTVPI